MEEIDSLYVFSEVNINTKALNFIAQVVIKQAEHYKEFVKG